MTIISTDMDVFNEVRTIKTIINHHIDYNGFKARETKHRWTDRTDISYTDIYTSNITPFHKHTFFKSEQNVRDPQCICTHQSLQ